MYFLNYVEFQKFQFIYGKRILLSRFSIAMGQFSGFPGRIKIRRSKSSPAFHRLAGFFPILGLSSLAQQEFKLVLLWKADHPSWINESWIINHGQQFTKRILNFQHKLWIILDVKIALHSCAARLKTVIIMESCSPIMEQWNIKLWINL